MEVGFSLVTLSPGHPGGSETYARGLLAGLAGQPTGDRITVLADELVAGSLAGVDGTRVRLAPTGARPIGRRRAGRAAAFVRHAIPSASSGRFDVMHYPLTVPLPPTRAPRVVTLQDINHRDLAALWGRAERTYRRVVYERAARRAAVVVTAAEYTRRRLIEALGIAPERVVAIAYGVDARFTPEPTAADADLDLPEPYILYPAADWPHKNHERLVRAFAAAAPPGLALVLTGNRGRRWARIQRVAGELGVGACVHHLGRVGDAAMPGLYRRARALVFPSLYEGWGLPPLEAMACGCPVASSTRAALAEACGDAALAFDPEDERSIGEALARVVEDDALRGDLRGRGLARAAGFTWERSAREHAAAYRHAAASSSR
jgi:glycosyltransferase involved in cell wall biosynthesis